MSTLLSPNSMMTEWTTWDLISQSLLPLNSSLWEASCLAPQATPEKVESVRKSHQEVSLPKAPREWLTSVCKETWKTLTFRHQDKSKMSTHIALQKERVRMFVTQLDTSLSSCNLVFKHLAKEPATSQIMTLVLPKVAQERPEGQMVWTNWTCLKEKWRNSAWMLQMLTQAARMRMSRFKETLFSALVA